MDICAKSAGAHENKGLNTGTGLTYPTQSNEAGVYNALNHTNFGPPERVITAPASFGVITSTVGTPRNIELALKLYF